VTLLFAGYDLDQIAVLQGVKRTTIQGRLQSVGRKIGGPRWASSEKRCLIWKAMEIGVIQYLAALRGDDGRLLAPPPDSPPIVVVPT